MARARVLVRRVADLPAAVAEALDFLEYDFAGKKTWVKPNLLGPHPPEHSVTTQPELVRAVVGELRTRGAAAVRVGDNPAGRIAGPIAGHIAVTGVVEASDGCFVDAARNPVELPVRSRFIDSVMVSRLVFDSDVILNLPVLKTHALTLLTGSVKNLLGIVPGAQKAWLHTRARTGAEFAELLVDLYAALPLPVLTVMDALLGMDGRNGPGSGRALRIGRLITGADAVAVDSVMALMAGMRTADLPMLRVAGTRGLGPVEPGDIDIAGDFEVLPGFRLPSSRLATSAGSIAPYVYRLLQRRPILVPGRCIRCGRCADGCPVGAITLDPWPRIERHKCITCYCCSETCPVRALEIPGLLRGLVQYVTGR